MKLVLGDLEIPVTATTGSPIISKHTGKELRRLELHVYIQGEALKETVSEYLKDQDANIVTLLEDDGANLGTWSAKQTSMSYTEGVPVFNYYFDLVEWENLNPRAIRLGDVLELEPYYYEEGIEKDAIVVTARFVISPEKQDDIFLLSKDNPYFSVVRLGISEEPLMMRLGVCIWSQAEEGTVKQELILVQDVYDDNHKKALLFEPQFSNIQDYLISQSMVLADLLNLLKEKEILSVQEFNDIFTTHKEFRTLQYRDFRRVDDLDEWRD